MGLLSAQKSRIFHNANMEYDNFQKAIDDGVPMVVIHFDPKTHEEIGREEYILQNVSISEFQAELLARALLPSIYEFYADPENVRKFEEWKADKEDNK